jgi:hypothetical protein
MAKKPAAPAVENVKSTALVPAAANLPVDVRKQLADEAAAMKDRIKAPTGDKIKLTKGKKFKLPDGTESEGPLTVVVLDFVSTNTYHDRPYKEGEASSPACFAIGKLESDKLTPSPNSPDKQSDTCGECPNNEFGSKGDGKACKNGRRLAVIAGEGDLASDPKSPMWLLDVSPTAVKAWDAYVASIRTQYGMPPVVVVTDVFFDPTSEFQSLRFGNPQPNANLEMHLTRRAAAVERLTQEPDVSKYEKPGKKAAKR